MDRYFVGISFPTKDRDFWETELGIPQFTAAGDFPGWEFWTIEEVSDVYNTLREAAEEKKSFRCGYSGTDCRTVIGHAGRWKDAVAYESSLFPAVQHTQEGPDKWSLEAAQTYWDIYAQMVQDIGGDA